MVDDGEVQFAVDGFPIFRVGAGQDGDTGVYSYNNITAQPNDDGSITIHLGGDPDQINYLPIADGWNYAIRMYEPEPQILDGTWTFPKIQPLDR